MANMAYNAMATLELLSWHKFIPRFIIITGYQLISLLSLLSNM